MNTQLWSGRLFGKWAWLEKECGRHLFRCGNFELSTRGSFGIKVWFHEHAVLSIGVPFICTIYIPMPWPKKRHIGLGDDPAWGIAYHSQALWFYWGTHYKAFHVPWKREWLSTEILTPDCKTTVYIESRDARRLVRKVSRMAGNKERHTFDDFQTRQEAEKRVSQTFDYTYVLRDGTVQKRKATLYVSRYSHGHRWWPWPTKVSTSIWVNFDNEVGERTGSWKGGTTGCGYDILPGETPEQTLRRMERERKFT